MKQANVADWLSLKMVDGVGAVIYKLLINAFGSPASVFDADLQEISKVAGIGEKIARKIKRFDKWQLAEAEAKRAADSNVSIVTINDKEYPGNLRNIYDPPPFLYVRGALSPSDIYVAIVGSRLASEYGTFVTQRLACELAQKGITVVSGLARGIDAAAHRGAISGKGRTIAVLGCGLDVMYPFENKALFEKIPVNGAIISEYPFGMPPNSENFPTRNRLISGISLGVVVVEATDKSGSLITARLAAEQGREVFAVPGAIDAKGSKGTNFLIKSGAKLVESANDIVEEIVPQLNQAVPEYLQGEIPFQMQRAATNGEMLTEREKNILKLISNKRASIDDIARQAGSPISETLQMLAMLELKGFIKRLPGQLFILEDY